MFTFALFLPCLAENPLRWSAGGLLSDAGVNECRLIYRAGLLSVERAKSNHPPPIWGAASAFSPHNFPHQKYRKKSPWQD